MMKIICWRSAFPGISRLHDKHKALEIMPSARLKAIVDTTFVDDRKIQIQKAQLHELCWHPHRNFVVYIERKTVNAH